MAWPAAAKIWTLLRCEPAVEISFGFELDGLIDLITLLDGVRRTNSPVMLSRKFE